MANHEELRDDDKDYVIIKEYKSAHSIDRDCNTPDVVVLMRRARFAERQRCATVADEVASESAGASAQIAANLIRKLQ